MMFSKLKEDSVSVSSDDGETGHTSTSPTTPPETAGKLAFYLKNELTRLVVCGTLVLILLILIINTRIATNSQLQQVSLRINGSDTEQNSLREEIQVVGGKLNSAMADLNRLKNSHDSLSSVQPWRAEQEQLKSRLKQLINANRDSLGAVTRDLVQLRTSYQAINASNQAQNNINQQMNTTLQFVKDDLSSLTKRTAVVEQIIHRRLDRTDDKHGNLSADFDDHRENIYNDLDNIRSLIENIQEEVESNSMHQSMTDNFLDGKIKYLEEALNLTVGKLADHKSGLDEFSNKTMNLLKSVMDLYKNQQELEKEENDGTPDQDVTVPPEPDTNQTEPDSSSSVEECEDLKKVPPSAITCTASSEYSKPYSCDKAFDGVLAIGKLGSAWASMGEGTGAWISANFSKPVGIREIKILQRFSPLEANRQIEIEFEGGLKQHATLPAKGSRHWNIIRLSKTVTSRTLKITITDVYGTVNNGFKEIAVMGCF